MVGGAGGIVKSGSGSDWRRLTSRFPANYPFTQCHVKSSAAITTATVTWQRGGQRCTGCKNQEHPVVPSDLIRDVPEAGREGGREGGKVVRSEGRDECK